MSDPSTDAELVRRARGGSDAAFAGLVQRHQGAVRTFLRRASGKGWAEADDLAQETFLVAWRSLGSLKDPAGFRFWLMGVAWKRAQDRTRSALRGAVRDRVWMEGQETARGVSAEDRLSLDAAMGDLPPDVRACVALCLAQDLSNAEAAQALGLPLGTVKSHVARGRARLLTALG
ncbi:MAG: sigma-70 family RNA polymerase sigma factor, partial [Brevundimonas sp.]